MGEGEEGSGASGNGAAVFGGDSPAGETGAIEETTEEVWDRVMDVNAKGVLWDVKHAVPAMPQAGGPILTIGRTVFELWLGDLQGHVG